MCFWLSVFIYLSIHFKTPTSTHPPTSTPTPTLTTLTSPTPKKSRYIDCGSASYIFHPSFPFLPLIPWNGVRPTRTPASPCLPPKAAARDGGIGSLRLISISRPVGDCVCDVAARNNPGVRGSCVAKRRCSYFSESQIAEYKMRPRKCIL